MGIRDWTKKFPWKKEGSDRKPPTSSTAPPPAAMNKDVQVSNPGPGPASSPPVAPSVSPPRTNQTTPVPDLSISPSPIHLNTPVPVSDPVPTPTSTIPTKNQEVPTTEHDAISTPPPPAKTTSTNSVGKAVGNGLVVTLKLLKEAVTGVGVPGLEAAVSGVVGVIDLIKDVRDNSDDLDDLNRLLSTLANAIKTAPNLHQEVEVDGVLRSRIDGFLSGLREMMEQVQEMLSEGVVSRTANSQAHKDAIQDIKSGITFLLNQFTAHGTLSLELNMAGARQDIRMLAKAQEALALARESEDLIRAIPRAGARYNDTSTKPSRPCHPGTRTGLLDIITKWIVEDLDAKPYFWLCGEVGVGKTTVAHTIAQDQEALKRLGACFFFSRHDESRRNPFLLVTSIAYQLARFDQGFYNALAKVLKPDPDLVKRTPTEQFEKLVLGPLIQSGINPSRTIVVVIDGLDECSDPASILDVLTLGTDNVGVRLRVLISSRPYASILSKFKNPRLYHLTSETQFRDISPKVLNDDVTTYLSWELGAIASRWQLPSPWPLKAQLDELIRRAAGLFIIASTYTKYLENPEVGDPADQLERILSRQRKVGSSPLAELDALYDQVLDDLKSRLPSDVVMARDILAFVIHGADDINVQLLAGLLHVNPSDVRLVLRHLTAVIPLPVNDDAVIVPFHASFGEYIQDSTRCTLKELSVDMEPAYGQMVVRCSDVVTSAADIGIVGVEYRSARGSNWTPPHLYHVADYMDSYLSRATPGQMRKATRNLVGSRMWMLFHIQFCEWTVSKSAELIDAVGGFKDLPDIKGTSKEEKAGSLGLLMISQCISEINQISENNAVACGRAGVEDAQLIRLQALRFVELQVDNGEIETTLEIVRNVRCWMKYTHKNIMLFDSMDIEFDDKNVPHGVLIFVAPPISIQQSSSLHEFLKRNNDLDMTSRVRMALNIADGLHYLHRSSPPQPHNGLNTHHILVSGKGQPILYPSTWILDFQSRPPPSETRDIDDITCQFELGFSRSGWYHWNPTGGDEWQESLEARLQVDVWDLGSILYQMITGEEPLTMYNRLAEGNKAFDYEPPTGQDTDDNTWEHDPWDVSRYETAVPLLLNALEASKDIKALVKFCWTIRRQDRPPMSEVFERLKAIVKAMET